MQAETELLLGRRRNKLGIVGYSETVIFVNWRNIGDIIHYAWCVRMQVSNTIAEVDNER
jgi:hypothetical protein